MEKVEVKVTCPCCGSMINLYYLPPIEPRVEPQYVEKKEQATK